MWKGKLPFGLKTLFEDVWGCGSERPCNLNLSRPTDLGQLYASAVHALYPLDKKLGWPWEILGNSGEKKNQLSRQNS
jgi:hypothetical protein